jgi:hypothetical protein
LKVTTITGKQCGTVELPDGRVVGLIPVRRGRFERCCESPHPKQRDAYECAKEVKA